MPKYVHCFKNLMVTWKGSRLWFKKWTIKTKTLILPLNIHKSKLILQVPQDSKDCTMNFSLVFLAILGKVSCIRVCLDGNLTWGFYLKTNLLKNDIITRCGWSSLILVQWTCEFIVLFSGHHGFTQNLMKSHSE
jgi:hypothetical protein